MDFQPVVEPEGTERIRWRSFLESQFQASCREEACRLDGLLERERRNGACSYDLTTSFSLSRLLQKRVAWLIILCFSVFSVIFAIVQESRRLSHVTSGTAFRFTPYTRAAETAAIPVETKFSVLTKCGLVPPTSQSVLNGTVIISYDNVLEVTGWGYNLPEAEIDNSPNAWKMEYRNGAKQDFQLVSRFRTNCQPWSVFQGADGSQTVEISLGREASIIAVLFRTVCGAGPMVTLLFSVKGRILLATRTLLGSLYALTALALAAAILCQVAERNQGAALRWGEVAILTGLVSACLSFKRTERFVGFACMAAGATVVVLEIAQAAGGFGRCSEVDPVQSHAEVYAGAGVLLLGFVMRFCCCRATKSTRARLYQYQARFREVWAELQASEEEEGELAALAALCDDMAAVRPQTAQRQLLQRYPDGRLHTSGSARSIPSLGSSRSGSYSRGASSRSWSFKRGPSRWAGMGALPSGGSSSRSLVEAPAQEGLGAVRSLDQLFAQAAGASLLLRRQVQHLALHSRGMLPLAPHAPASAEDKPYFVRWREAMGCPELRARIRWTALKPEKRAVEKVLNRFNGNIARLVDVSRESVFFERVADMSAALRLLVTDSRVDIVRVLNNMNLGECEPCWGFRSVVVHVRFIGADAQTLGLHGHISELKLVHQAFADCLTEEQREDFQQGLRQLRDDAEKETRKRPWTLSWPPWRSRSLRVAPDSDAVSLSGSLPSPVAGACGCAASRPPLGSPPRASRWALQPAGVLEKPLQVLPTIPPSPQSAVLEESGDFAGAEPSGPQPHKLSDHALAPEPRHSVGPLGQMLARSGPRDHRPALQSAAGTSRESEGGWPAELGAALEAGERECGVPPEVLLQQYRLRTLRHGPSELYERAPTLRESMDHCQSLSVLSTSFPIAAAMRKNYVPLFLLMLACAAGWALPSWHLSATEHASRVRLSALQLREPEAQPVAPILRELQLFNDGCRVLDASATQVSASFLQYEVRLRERAAFDEVRFSTPEGSPAFDPVTFSIEASDDGVAWREVAASRKVLRRNGSVRWDREPRTIPEERGREVRVSLDPLWFIGEVVIDVLSAMFAVSMTVLWLMGKYEWGKHVCLSFGASLGVEQLMCGVARSVLGFYLVFPLEFVRSAGYLGCTYWMSLREAQVLEVLMTDSLVNAVTYFIHYLAFDPAETHSKLSLLISSALVPLMCLSLICVKYRYKQAAFDRIRADFALYVEVWQKLYADPAQQEGCHRIAATLARVPLPAYKLRQTFLPWPSLSDALPRVFLYARRVSSQCSAQLAGPPASPALLRRAGSSGSDGRAVARLKEGRGPRRVATVGLLYRMAAGCQQLVQHKIREWCAASPVGALVPSKVGGEAGFVHVGGGGAEGDEEREWEAVVGKLPALKKVERASQKLMRAYKADTSRLMDVVRFSLVFDHASSLADMLDIVCRDAEVAVVGVKNRLRDSYNARQSAGFRDVHLNLVIETEEARRLGVHTHVWELQLTVTEICKLRSDGGHQRYVQYRDLKAE